MNNGEQTPLPSNKEIVDRIKSGELGPVQFKCADDAPEAEKLRVARANAEQEVAAMRAMVAQGVALQAVVMNLATAAEGMEKMGCDPDVELKTRHQMMDQARCLRITVNYMIQHAPSPRPEPSKN